MAQHNGAPAGQGGAAERSSRVPVALTEQQWAVLAPLVPGADSASRGRLAEPQSVVEGMLYAIRNGMGMQSVPPPYPSGSTLYRRFTAWTASGHWEAIWRAFLETLSTAERQEWQAAARKRPGAAVDGTASRPAQSGSPARPQLVEPPAVQAAAPALPAEEALPDMRAAAGPGQQDGASSAVELPPRPDVYHNGRVDHGLDGAQRNGASPPATASEPAGQALQFSVDAVLERVADRLGLSAAESEIVRRRIGDHGVSAALAALDEVEGRLATGMMRGVGGMPMSAFEIWVCAVGLARRPVERPRVARPERGDRLDGDRDRRKRQWRKSP